MNDLVGMIMNQLGDSDLDTMSQKAGLSKEQTQSAIMGSLPVLLNAIKGNAKTSKGASALAGALDRDHDGSILDNIGGFLSNSDEGPGDGILGHVLGGQRNSIENGLGQKLGVNSSSISSILKMVAPLLLGALGKQKRQQGLDSGGLGSLVGMAADSAIGNGDGSLDIGDLIGMVAGGKKKSGGLFGGLLGGLLGGRR